ncbi:hypothetical protein, partial [Lactococcus petauri]|uniref:hypothetical protein n=1 Tax=Lactococcus petauri TaxID=1940789 RepID=UPI0022E3261A
HETNIITNIKTPSVKGLGIINEEFILLNYYITIVIIKQKTPQPKPRQLVGNLIYYIKKNP